LLRVAWLSWGLSVLVGRRGAAACIHVAAGPRASGGLRRYEKEGPTRNRIVAVVAAAVLSAGLTVGLTVAPALADAVYHSSHIALLPTGATPLRSGFVENIHVNGPNVFAREIYVLNGAQPDTTYQVTLNIFALDPTCTGSPAAVVPTASITTNAAGNGRGDAVFRPSDVPAVLRHATHGIIWTVSDSSGVTFSSGCEVVTLD
jgi:hypothetical protein